MNRIQRLLTRLFAPPHVEVFVVHRGKSGPSSPVEVVCSTEADAIAHINAMTPAQQKRRTIIRWPLNG